jgi:hypothetical protein
VHLFVVEARLSIVGFCFVFHFQKKTGKKVRIAKGNDSEIENTQYNTIQYNTIQHNTSHITSSQVKSNQIKSSHVTSNQVRTAKPTTSTIVTRFKFELPSMTGSPVSGSSRVNIPAALLLLKIGSLNSKNLLRIPSG